ncbi:MAG: hypothetical protein EOO85_27695 [Pedobacter sp.]|nr:MAG: hypothetical protein EOO85_27695 [Pedobacter sp.]
MVRLKLNQTNFAGAEVLTREQLKKVLGGGGNESSGSGPKVMCCTERFGQGSFGMPSMCSDCITVHAGTSVGCAVGFELVGC